MKRILLMAFALLSVFSASAYRELVGDYTGVIENGCEHRVKVYSNYEDVPVEGHPGIYWKVFTGMSIEIDNCGGRVVAQGTLDFVQDLSGNHHLLSISAPTDCSNSEPGFDFCAFVSSPSWLDMLRNDINANYDFTTGD